MYKFAGYTGSWLYRLYRVGGYVGLLDVWVAGSIGKQDLQGIGIYGAVRSIGERD